MTLTNLVAIGFIVVMTGVAIGFLIVAQRLIIRTLNEERTAHSRQANAASIYIIRGYARRDAGDVAGAIIDFQLALKLQPDHQEASAVRELMTQLEQAH